MLDATITIDTSRTLGPVSPMIYGHFIEQLGRCITGGISAEMLRSRRFTGFDDDHNGIADPWRSSGRDSQTLVEPPGPDAPGWLTLRCLRSSPQPHQVEHPGLTVRHGVACSVSVTLRTSPGIHQVALALGGQTIALPAPGPDGARIERTIIPRWDIDDAALTIGCHGSGVMQILAPSLMPVRDREIGGVRSDVVELVRAIEPPIIRWPGGCFADGYRWRDGVGDPDERPASFDPAWEAWQDNDFGTDEFVRFCRLVGAEPYICVNTGSDTAASAAEWVRWCREHDLGVHWWGIGNETYGSWEIGSVPAEEYARLYLRFAEQMRAEHPSIELVAVGADPVSHPDWNRTVLGIAGRAIDHLSVHRYVPHRRDDSARERQYNAIVASSVDIERRLAMVADTLEEFRRADGRPGIAFDEWNVWLDADRGMLLEERYELRDALFAAGVLNAMHRLGGRITMANLAQLVNVLPAIVTSPAAAWGTPLYHAFALYRRCHGESLACECTGPAFDAEPFGNIPAVQAVPWLDASAVATASGREVILAVVNRHPSEPAAACIVANESLRGIERSVLEGADAGAANSERTPAAVAVSSDPLAGEGQRFQLELPPHSVTMLRFARRED